MPKLLEIIDPLPLDEGNSDTINEDTFHCKTREGDNTGTMNDHTSTTDTFISENLSKEITNIDDFKIFKLKKMVDNTILSQRWITEGVIPPTIECKNLSKEIIIRLYEEFQLFPHRISATVEEGIYVDYINEENGRELSIEIYNDLDAAALITKDDCIIISMDINLSINYDSEIRMLINSFYGK